MFTHRVDGVRKMGVSNHMIGPDCSWYDVENDRGGKCIYDCKSNLGIGAPDEVRIVEERG